jgi:hypothetical protein
MLYCTTRVAMVLKNRKGNFITNDVPAKVVPKHACQHDYTPLHRNTIRKQYKAGRDHGVDSNFLWNNDDSDNESMDHEQDEAGRGAHF